jgi:hypothetical protein
MGNMGHPVITRLGINQFWYKHWYSDTSKQMNLKQDDAFEQLLTLYLNYGLTFKTNPFIHEYWYKKHAKKVRVVDQELKNIKFFRRFFYTNNNLSIEHSYLIRHRTAEYFPMRHWVLKYGNWVILQVHWFKPLKTKTKPKTMARQVSFIGAVSRPKVFTPTINRLKLSYLYLSKVTLSKQNMYTF